MFGKMIGGGKSKSTDDIGNDTETIIPTIEITEYGSPLTPVLMEYEMIRMGRDAERTLSQLLVKAGSKKLNFKRIDSLLVSPIKRRQKVPNVPKITVTSCSDNSKTNDEMMEEMVRRAERAEMKINKVSHGDEVESGNLTVKLTSRKIRLFAKNPLHQYITFSMKTFRRERNSKENAGNDQPVLLNYKISVR